jgi:eukaryotic-like serine/threonine-protein kinase
LNIGDKLGPYEVIAALGAGGMGEVYRARDTKLNREVALKVLPEAFASDAQRMARFQREAQVLASLNHPHIAAIYGLEESGQARALVMELVEGSTLAERLVAQGARSDPAPLQSSKDMEKPPSVSRRMALPVDDALPIAKQIAEALEYAHERGIVHRDLKPANVKITPEGTVKVLDFGLAKALDPETEPGVGARRAVPLQESPTLSVAATQAGMILGTAAYMSPEQARGKNVDRRADIWAFGCVLFEMLAGQKTFEGETVSDVLAAVIRAEPDWTALPETTPSAIQRLIHRCLTKDPKQRLRDIGEARIAIEETLSGADSVAAVYDRRTASESGDVGARRALPLRALPWAVAALAALMGATAVWLYLNRPQPAERMQFNIPVPAEVGNMALSADGRMLAFVARDDASGENMLYFERLGSPRATLLAGTENASYPFCSPDDAYVGFFANGKLKKISVSGGPPQVLASASYGRGGSWGSRGVIIYAPDTGGPLWRVNADGTHAAPLTQKLYGSSENSHRWPLFLPDGYHFLYWSGSFGTKEDDKANGIYLSSLAAQQRKLIVSNRSNVGYTAGHLYYVDARKSLIAVPFNVFKGEISGEPVVVSDRVSYQPSVLWGAFGAGGNDTVVYNSNAGAALSALTWYDRSGKELGQVGEPGVMANPTISPDGTHAAVDITDLKSANIDIWIEDLGHGTASRFTFDPAEEVTGVWSRDGNLVAYRSIASGSGAVMIKKATGLEAPKQIYVATGGDDIMPNSWAADGQRILCSYQPAAGGSNLGVVDAATGKMTPFLATRASETNGMISPDGKWVAYASNESGDWEIYVTTFPGAQGKWQVSRGGGTEPRWRGDGKEIFYINPKGMLVAVPVSISGTFTAGAPSPLFAVHARAAISSTDLFTYDVARDGKRFLVDRYAKPQHIQPLTVVLHAAADMKK